MISQRDHNVIGMNRSRKEAVVITNIKGNGDSEREKRMNGCEMRREKAEEVCTKRGGKVRRKEERETRREEMEEERVDQETD